MPISPWLHRVTVNLAYNYVARRKRSIGGLDVVLENLVAGAGSSPHRHAERSEVQDLVHSAIDSLSLEHRIVVVLFYLGDFKLEEIAYILDCPVGTVKSRLHYARGKLRVQLAGEMPSGPDVAYGLA